MIFFSIYTYYIHIFKIKIEFIEIENLVRHLSSKLKRIKLSMIFFTLFKQ